MLNSKSEETSTTLAKPTAQQASPRLLLAIATGIILGALDGAVIATALPRISASLGGTSGIAWAAGAYLFGTATSASAWGSLGDTHGHQRVLRIGLALLLTGTLACAFAGYYLAYLSLGMVELALGRFIQGVGSGAVFSAGFALIADLFSARRRARNAGRFSIFFAIATLAGPVIGGVVSDSMTVSLGAFTIEGWRFIFLLQLPLAGLALLAAPREVERRALAHRPPFDRAGLAILSLMMLLCATGLQQLRAGAAALAAMLLLAAVLAGALLIICERRAAQPLLPPTLLRIPMLRAACLAGTASSAALLCVAIATPAFLQIGEGRSASDSGLVMTAFSLGIAAGAMAGGRWLARTGDCRKVSFFAVAVALAGVAIIALGSAGVAIWAAKMFVAGLGFGPLQSVFAIAAQDVAPEGRRGTTGGLVQSSRRLGATMGGFVGGLLTLEFGGRIRAGMPALPQIGDLLLLAMATTAFLLLAAAAIRSMPAHLLHRDVP